MLIEELVIVPGHATFSPKVGANLKSVDVFCEDNWLLLPYQIGEVGYYLQHIHEGLEILKNNQRAMLVFAGGYTRAESPLWSEAKTYWQAAKTICQTDCGFDALSGRIYLEERSTDSLQNLACSLDLFKLVTGRLPKVIKTVGWKFKKYRYYIHAQSIGWPKAKFEYFGVNDPEDINEALRAERRTIGRYTRYFDDFTVDKPSHRIWKLEAEMKTLIEKVTKANYLSFNAV